MFLRRKTLLDETIEAVQSDLFKLDPQSDEYLNVAHTLVTLYQVKRHREDAKEREIRDRAKKLGNLAGRSFERIVVITYKAFGLVRNIRS